MARDDRRRDRKRAADTADDDRGSRDRSESPVRDKRRRSRSKSADNGGNAAGYFGISRIITGFSDSLSIEETNRLRAQLGLAPLEVEDAPKIRDAEDGNLADKIINEEGFEFRHRKAENWGDKKRDAEIKEKIETAKKKREIYSKILKSKGLADHDSDDDAADWVNKMRQEEEERKKAAERAKMLDEFDDELAVDVKKVNKKPAAKQLGKKSKTAITAGLTIGHDRSTFLSGEEHILVLQDKGVLDDDDEEVLINPNLVDDERTSRNNELKKRRGFRDTADVDEFGNPKDHGILAKYDDELEGVAKSSFKLNDRGEVNITREKEEIEMRQRLENAGKILVSLDDSNKFNKASEFYTEEEMISFRKTKKDKKEKKLRKRGKAKMLKAEDLMPLDEPSSSNLGSRRTRQRNDDDEASEDVKPRIKKEIEEDGEINEEAMDDGRWRRTKQQGVDIEALKKIAERELEEQEDSDDDIVPGVDLSNVVIDDDAHGELSAVLDKARRLKSGGVVKFEPIDIKQEPIDEEMHDDPSEGGMLIDATMEYCRNVGEISTHGIAGNRSDVINYDRDDDEEDEPEPESEEEEQKPAKEELDDDSETMDRLKKVREERRKKEKEARESRGGWTDAGKIGENRIDADDEEALRDMKDWQDSEDSEDEDSEKDEDVLGGEIDASKGVGAMLKLAAKKGYLHDVNSSRKSGESLDHLKSKNFSKIEGGKYDIDEKYTKKLEKLGKTGRGPTMEFSEKKNYVPDVSLSYVDNRGRELDPKDAFRIMSWKFHGKKPGKKQQEKRARQIDQKELLKTYHSSSDTPLGTLSRQRAKQEQLQTPYLILSGNANHQNFKKE